MRRFAALVLFLFVAAGCGSRPSLLWKFQTGGPIYSSPIVAGGVVIFGSSDHHLYGVDPSGKQVWKQDLGERVPSTPYADASGVYVGSGSGNFYSIDPATGNVRWKFHGGSFVEYRACGEPDALYFGDNGGNFYRIDKKGNKVWQTKLGFKIGGKCEVYKNLVLTSSWDSNYYGIDKQTGQIAWKLSSGIINYGGPAMAGDIAYFASHNYIYAIQAETGRLVRKITTTYLDHPVVYRNYLWTCESGLAKRTLDGQIVAQARFSPAVSAEPGIGSDLFIMNAERNWLYAFSTDVKLLWKYKGGEEFRTPGVFHDGVYYVGNRDANLYALRLPK